MFLTQNLVTSANCSIAIYSSLFAVASHSCDNLAGRSARKCKGVVVPAKICAFDVPLVLALIHLTLRLLLKRTFVDGINRVAVARDAQYTTSTQYSMPWELYIDFLICYTFDSWL